MNVKFMKTVVKPIGLLKDHVFKICSFKMYLGC